MEAMWQSQQYRKQISILYYTLYYTPVMMWRWYLKRVELVECTVYSAPEAPVVCSPR
jgi:hypothetical protein